MSTSSSSTLPSAGPHVFVSHSHQDNDYCREFVAELRRALGDAGTIWYDEHNLGWGALRATIDKQLEITEHFIALLSPAALGSEWVNAEIDAALHLLSTGQMRTLVFVTAQRGMVSPLLQRYKRIERADGLPYSPAEAAARAVPILLSGRVESRATPPPSSQPIIAPSAEGPVIAEVAAPPPLEAVSFLQAEPMIAASPPMLPPQPLIPVPPAPPSPFDLSAASEAPVGTVSSDIAAIPESEPSSPPEPAPPSQPPSSHDAEIPPATDMQVPATARPHGSRLMRTLIALILVALVLGSGMFLLIGKLTSSNQSNQSNHSNQSNQNVSGTWLVYQHENGDVDYYINWTLQQNGNQLSGTWSRSPYYNDESFTGTISGNTLSLNSSGQATDTQGQPFQYTLHYDGYLTDSGQSDYDITGTWTESLTNIYGTHSASGTFGAVREA